MEDDQVAQRAVTPEGVREIVREEIASLAGLALRRTQDEKFTRSLEHNLATEAIRQEQAEFWGEVLRDFGGTQLEPGPKAA